MSEPLRAITANVLRYLAESFVFRKLGMVYDYYSSSFPSPLLPNSKEVRKPTPNAYGFGTGMADCALNGALLFDSYALRLEIGYATEDEERIYDRLIGGLIRLSTSAPRNTVIRGLSPDGKSYYPLSGYEPVLYWAFYAWRAALTPTQAPESQNKIKNIALHWMENLEQNKWQILGRDNVLNNAGFHTDLIKPALLAVAFALTKMEKWKMLALKTFSANTKIDEPATVEQLFTMQLSLFLLTQIFPDELPTAREKMLAIAKLAYPHLSTFRQFDEKILTDETPLDWRAMPENSEAIIWARIIHENNHAAHPALAALIILWAGDADFLHQVSGEIKAMLTTIPWEKLWLARALSPIASIHSLGVTYGLWDNDLSEYQTKKISGESSLVAPLMEPNYDSENPDKSGHLTAANKHQAKVVNNNVAPQKTEKTAPAAFHQNYKQRNRNRHKSGKSKNKA